MNNTRHSQSTAMRHRMHTICVNLNVNYFKSRYQGTLLCKKKILGGGNDDKRQLLMHAGRVAQWEISISFEIFLIY